MRARPMVCAVATAWLGLAGGSPASAQPGGDAQRERADEQRAQADAQRERAGIERELARAREQMAEAARDVARLSAELTGPLVDDVTRRFRYAGQRAMLGLNIEDTELGVRVAGVSPNGPAAAAGLAVGDTIVAIEGAELAGGASRAPSELLLAQMANVEPGERVDLRVLRDGDYRNVEVQARAIEPGQFFDYPGPGFAFSFPGPDTWNGMFRPRPWRDLELVTLTPALGAYFGTDKGLLVVRAPRDAALGLQDGDVILDIGGREPLNPEHAARILASFEPGETLRVTVMRRQRRETIEIGIPADPPG